MQRKKIFDSFKHWNVAILSVLMSFCMTAAFAQSGAVKGKVLDELGEPIIGANIVEKGTTNGTITDIDGNYTLSVNDLKKAILQVSFIGYNSVEEAVKGRSAVDVKLGASVVNLGEVVAIGYGTQTRREITGSVANISEENFNKGVNRDASDLLQGKVAGLTITSGSGDVTRSSQIQLRGTSTLQNDQGPMIVIDGVPGGDMSTVSPSDIESISVLKDASSAAIYGSRAAGGVILITTKRGSGSRTQINYDGYLTASTIANKPDMLNASEWRAANKALGKDISTYDKYNSDTDWFDEMTRVGVSQQHALSLSGGSSKSNYRASYTFLDRNGVARDNYMTRHSFRFQFQQRAINDRLRIGLTGAATLTDMQMPFSDDYILAYNMLPVYPVYNADGSYFTDANHNYDQGNPVQNQDQNYKKAANNYFYGQGDVQFSILDGLTTKVNLYKSRFSSDYSEWQDPRNSRGQGDTGKAIRRNRLWDRNLLEWTANYTKAFGSAEEHKVDAIVGYSWENNLYADQKSEATNFAVGSMGADNIQSGNLLKIGNVTSSRNEYKLISLFARAHYSFKERYMITATVRRDGSSKFGANHKWGTFPSVSAAWGISQESFMEPTSDWLSNLKIRASYGTTGNDMDLSKDPIDKVDAFSYLQKYQLGEKYIFGNNLANTIVAGATPNYALTWATSTTYNGGLDFGFFNNRLSGTFDAFYRKEVDILGPRTVTLPSTYGQALAPENYAERSWRGGELALTWMDKAANGEITYSAYLNLGFARDRWDVLDEDATYREGGNLHALSKQGKAEGILTGLIADHLLTDPAEVEALKAKGFKQFGRDPYLGGILYKDTRGDGYSEGPDGRIDSNDEYNLLSENGTPRINYGFGGSIKWKGITLDVHFQGVGKYDRFIGGVDGGFYQHGGTIRPYFPIWTSDKVYDPELNPDGVYPRITGTSWYESGAGNTSYWMRNGAYLRLKNLNIGYDLPMAILRPLGITHAQVFANATNLFCISAVTEFLDPEQEYYDSYPLMRTFSFGLNFSF